MGRQSETAQCDTCLEYTVFCPAKCGTETDIRNKPVRQQTGWLVMICHGFNSEYSMRTATCSRCTTVAHKCRCHIVGTHHKNKASKNWLQQHIDKTQMKRALPASKIIHPTHDVPDATEFVTQNQERNGPVQELQKAVEKSTTTAHESTRGQKGQRQAVLTRATPFDPGF